MCVLWLKEDTGYPVLSFSVSFLEKGSLVELGAHHYKTRLLGSKPKPSFYGHVDDPPPPPPVAP